MADRIIVLHHPNPNKAETMTQVLQAWQSSTVVQVDAAELKAELLNAHKTVIAVLYDSADADLDDYDMKYFVDGAPAEFDLTIIDLEKHIEVALKDGNRPQRATARGRTVTLPTTPNVSKDRKTWTVALYGQKSYNPYMPDWPKYLHPIVLQWAAGGSTVIVENAGELQALRRQEGTVFIVQFPGGDGAFTVELYVDGTKVQRNVLVHELNSLLQQKVRSYIDGLSFCCY